MADTSQGDGWWEASDHKWYPPRLHADPAYRARYRPPPPAPIEPASTEVAAHAVETAPEPVADPQVFGGARRPWRATAAALALILLVGAAAAVWLTRDDAGDDTAAGTATGGSSVADDATGATTDAAAPVEARVGSPERPARFGEIHQWTDWRAGVIEVLDPLDEGLLAEFGEGPADENAFVTVIYEVSYLGDDLTGYEPILVTAVGSEAYEGFGCFLDSAALSERGVHVLEFELIRGATMRLAECFEVPEAEVDDLVFTLENFEEFDGEVVFSADGEALPDLAPVTVGPDYSEVPMRSFGTMTDWEEWSATVTALEPAEGGVVSRFSDPPRPGHSYQIIAYDVTYLGTEPLGYLQVYPTALGSAVFTSQGCVLDSELLQSRGFDVSNELRPNTPTSVAECVEVPDEELDELVIRLESFGAIGDLPTYYSANA